MLLVLLIIPTAVLAEKIVTTSESSSLTIATNLPNAIPQSTLREWEIHVFNSTSIIEDGCTCRLHIYEEFGDGGHMYINESSTFSNQDIEIIVPATLHTTKGLYSYKVYCNTTNEVGLYETNYYVTKNGYDPAGDFFTIFIWLVFILAILGLIYTLFINIARLSITATTIYDVLLSWGFYILTIISLYLSQNFLIETLIERISGTLIAAAGVSNVLFPIFAFVLCFFVRGAMKKRPLGSSDLGGRLQ